MRLCIRIMDVRPHEGTRSSPTLTEQQQRAAAHTGPWGRLGQTTRSVARQWRYSREREQIPSLSTHQTHHHSPPVR